jgi:uroporphyrinogen III methyltransferase/synthase
MISPPTVYLVGAGPGNPALLTLRAVECLAQADLVLYDKLSPARALEYAPPTAERVCVTELAESHVERYQPVQRAMIEAARQGRRVVRLKGGDPYVFGRGGEEAEALYQAGIPFEVVPGVTAALGAASYAGIPLTHRLHASAVALVTGHENPAKPESALDWGALAKFPGTLVVYMGMARLAKVVAALLQHGKDGATPAAVVHWSTTGEQQTVEAPLRELPGVVQWAGVAAPALIVIGPVVALRPHLAWFERRPLFGKRVLVTRPRRQAGDLVRRLELLGAVPFVLPAVDVGPPDDWGPVDRALERLADYRWLVFTSTNGVHGFLERLRARGRDLRALGGLSLAAIGPATADALRGYHLEPDVVPGQFVSEELVAALRERVVGQAVLLARADRGREVLRDELAKVARVEQVAVYSQKDAVDAGAPALDCLRRGELDYVTLTSANIARALVRALDEVCRARLASGQVKLVSISPVTSAAVRELGLPVAAEAAEYTMGGVVDALLRLAGGEGGSTPARSGSEGSHLP